MAWIEEIDEGEASGELAEVYGELLRQRGKIANILKVHSLNPAALRAHLDLYMALLFGRSGLSRAEREAIAVVTSATNRCDYCVNHHAAALERLERDAGAITKLRAASELDSLPPRLAAIAQHAEKLTAQPDAVTHDDVVALRAAGLDDRDILDVTLVTAYFNFVNRVALGLGVTFSEKELTGYKS